MKYTTNNIQKQSVLKNIEIIMKRHHEIILDYVFGSFIHGDTFSDIDIGVLTDKDMISCLGFEFNLEIEIEDDVNHPIDVRVLNHAPFRRKYLQEVSNAPI